MKEHRTAIESGNALRIQLKWLIFYRILIVTLLLGATAILQVRESQFYQYASPLYLYLLIGFTYALTLIYALILGWIRRHRLFAYTQIFVDVLFITLLINFTGGIESIFSWVYILSIFSAGTILYRRGGLFIASASSILYGTLLDLEFFHVILPLGKPANLDLTYSSSYVFYLILVNMVAFYLVAILSAYLSEKLRRKESELKERLIDYDQLEWLYKYIVENVASGLITIDIQGRITSFNRMAEEITGYTMKDVYYQDIRTLFPELLLDDLTFIVAHPKSIQKAEGSSLPRSSHSNTIKLSRQETKFKRKDGTALILGLSISSLKDSNYQEIGSILIFQDLTRLREMEEDLKRADRLAAVGELAAGMAHEIRNPMASISGSIEVLKDEMSTSTQGRHLMDIALRELNRLNTLIADFLLFARPVSKGKEVIQLNEIVEDTLNIFANSTEYNPEIRFITRFQEDLIMEGEPQQIKQVFWNLFLNAVQAMPDGGELSIELRKSHSTTASQVLQQPSPPLPPPLSHGEGSLLGEILVTDTGMGIDEKDLGKIFNPFFTTKTGGTGLGLAIAHRIVEAHGGKITVRSQPGQGTTFIIYFPLH